MAKNLIKAIEAMESVMTPESVVRARKKADLEIFAVKLGQLREKCGYKQTDIRNFSQTSVSRLERRNDIKISTLVNYLDGLNMGLEIRTYPKNKEANINEEILLRV